MPHFELRAKALNLVAREGHGCRQAQDSQPVGDGFQEAGVGKSMSLRLNSAVYSQLPGVLVFELFFDDLWLRCAFGMGAMRTPVSTLPVPGNTNG